ncbi:hypothetical protein CMU66_04165 [Elizabethkingia anophelis]|nr:hypothetical protein [Elizabethkingia anophelis]MDV3564379.1 hypothetical protein [Elizabethkingia anophelis]MDV3623146.1 hypothetical protein [Elizabethkingia anophelis]MDV3643806.1 hypothetical protein [Elizabethkingia anophelis]MDV3656014.1 hypothetical protein [Elizabethkingia anophelis]
MKKKEMQLINENEKKAYISPKLNVEIIMMECGIAANSSLVSPGTTNGIADAVHTDWEGNDDTTINTGVTGF